MADVATPPPTRYARSGELSIAYHVLGEGPFDLVVTPGFISHLEVEYGWPALVEFYERLSRFCRVIRFDKRGTGLSDRVAGIATPEERMDDVRAVMDAAGSRRATLMGISEGGPVSALFAATYPERTQGLILCGSNAGPTSDRSPEGWDALATRVHNRYGSLEEAREDLASIAPSLAGDPLMVEFVARYFRAAASPGAVVQVLRMNAALDVREVYPTISVPTLILHRVGDRNVSIDNARYLAEHIPGANYRELEGDDHLPWVGDSDTIVDEIEEFVTGVRDPGGRNRVLATVLFTDIVGSTEQALEVGDRRWRELLEQHHAMIRKELDRFRGREIDTAGDGFLASFDGPARAVRCAARILESVHALGLQLRAGLHTGECEQIGEKLTGQAVHLGARVAAHAEAGEILVSSTVKDLVAGSGLGFDDRGSRELKGFADEWRLYAVDLATIQAPVR